MTYVVATSFSLHILNPVIFQTCVFFLVGGKWHCSFRTSSSLLSVESLLPVATVSGTSCQIMWRFWGHQILLSLHLEKGHQCALHRLLDVYSGQQPRLDIREFSAWVCFKRPSLGKLASTLLWLLNCHVLCASRKEELSTLTGHGATLTSRCGSTLPLQISHTRAVHLVTAGNDRGGLRDRSRPPEPKWLLTAIAVSSSSVE